jgi:hypothetical protein
MGNETNGEAMKEESIPIVTRDKNILTFWEDVNEHPRDGQMMFDKVLFMRIRTPGDKSEMIHEVDREYPEGYPNQVYGKIKKNKALYERFGEYIEKYKRERETGIVVEGTPIENWPLLDVRRVALLKHLGIFSIEQLADLNDSAIPSIGLGARELIQKAKDWIRQSKDAATAMQALERERAVNSRFDALQEQLNELAEALNELPAEARAQVQDSIQKRRRGRPPKVA